jgi:two-component system, NarL family, response regulator
MNKPPIRVLIADDHYMMRLGLASLLGKEPDLQVVAEANTGIEAAEQCEVHRPDVVLMDIRMPGLNGIEATALIWKRRPETRVIILTTYEGDEDVFQALKAGAKAYFLKTVGGAEILKAIRAVQAGEYCLPVEVAAKLAQRCGLPDLTAREREILERIAAGRSNKEIAGLLSVAENTVKNHVHVILEKLGVQDRTQAVTRAIERGILHLG